MEELFILREKLHVSVKEHIRNHIGNPPNQGYPTSNALGAASMEALHPVSCESIHMHT